MTYYVLHGFYGDRKPEMFDVADIAGIFTSKENYRKFVTDQEKILEYAKRQGYKVINRFYFVVANKIEVDDECDGYLHGNEFVGNCEIPFYVISDIREDDLDRPCTCKISNTKKEISILRMNYIDD